MIFPNKEIRRRQLGYNRFSIGADHEILFSYFNGDTLLDWLA